MVMSFKVKTIGDIRCNMICGLYYKCFMIVIYNRNDVGLYYKIRDNHN